jgi:hypothetical protein
MIIKKFILFRLPPPILHIIKMNNGNRQTTSFIDYSIEAGILLGGNGTETKIY